MIVNILPMVVAALQQNFNCIQKSTKHYHCNVQVSISTNQLFLAFQVKADSNSAAMDGLQNAKAAIKRATDELVRVAKDSIREEETPVMIKTDIFKEVEADICKITRYDTCLYSAN